MLGTSIKLLLLQGLFVLEWVTIRKHVCDHVCYNM